MYYPKRTYSKTTCKTNGCNLKTTRKEYDLCMKCFQKEVSERRIKKYYEDKKKKAEEPAEDDLLTGLTA